MQTATTLTKRNIGGKRVITPCTMLFPKQDVFSHTQSTKTGILVFNVRGCSFYCKSQFTEKTIKSVFDDGQPTTLSKIILSPSDAREISLKNLQARFLKFNHFPDLSGMVLRFVHQTEQQLDTLNSLTDSLTSLYENEEHHVKALMA